MATMEEFNQAKEEILKLRREAAQKDGFEFNEKTEREKLNQQISKNANELLKNPRYATYDRDDDTKEDDRKLEAAEGLLKAEKAAASQPKTEFEKDRTEMVKDILKFRREAATLNGKPFDETAEREKINSEISKETLKISGRKEYFRYESDDRSGIEQAELDAAKLIRNSDKFMLSELKKEKGISQPPAPPQTQEPGKGPAADPNMQSMDDLKKEMEKITGRKFDPTNTDPGIYVGGDPNGTARKDDPGFYKGGKPDGKDVDPSFNKESKGNKTLEFIRTPEQLQADIEKLVKEGKDGPSNTKPMGKDTPPQDPKPLDDRIVPDALKGIPKETLALIENFIDNMQKSLTDPSKTATDKKPQTEVAPPPRPAGNGVGGR